MLRADNFRSRSQQMVGFLFLAFLITLILGGIIATAGDDLRALWHKVIDSIDGGHHSSAEQYYKQLPKYPEAVRRHTN